VNKHPITYTIHTFNTTAPFRTVLVLILVVCSLSSSGQYNCTGKLAYAHQLFDLGQIEQIPSLLDSCLEKGFSKDEQADALRLLIQVYIFDSNRSKAEQVMIRYLKIFPEYTLKPDDPVEFTEIYKAFRVMPNWSFGFTAGLNMTQVLVWQHFSTESLNKSNSSYSPAGLGFDAGFHVNRYFMDNLWLSLDVRGLVLKFQRKDVIRSQSEELTYRERSGWITAPLYVNYSVGKGRFSPYAFIGGEAGYLLSSNAEIQRHQLDNVVPDMTNSVSVKNSRKALNFWALGGLGVRYKLPGGFLNFSLGYHYAILPYENKNKRYTNSNDLFYYQYVDDDFSVNRFSCSIGYSKLLYKIKKRKVENAGTNK
jgi:hypothetical protein